MVNNNNSATTKELIEAGRLQVLQGVPQTISNYIQPVMEVNPKLLRNAQIVRYSNRTTTGAGSAYTTPATQDFYLCGITYHLIKDVACDAATGRSSVNITVDGSAREICVISVITLTAQDVIISHDFQTSPIKIDRNISINTNLSYAAGVCSRSITIWGFIVDNTNA